MVCRPVLLCIFGCFNPPTYGHISCVMAAEARLKEVGSEVHRILFVPVFDAGVKDNMADALHRIEMCGRLASVDARIGVSDSHVRRGVWPGIRECVDELADSNREFEIVVCCGGDTLPVVTRNHNAKLRSDFRIIGVARKGAEFRGPVEDVDFIESDATLKVSSTLVRAEIARGRWPRADVPERVLSYVRENNLYR